jgi:hypothetical protein
VLTKLATVSGDFNMNGLNIDVTGLVKALLSSAITATTKIVITVDIYKWSEESIRHFVMELIEQSRIHGVTVLGIRCDTYMLTKIGAERVNIYGGLIGSTPISINNSFYTLEAEISI